jgi:hypothetical protein
VNFKNLLFAISTLLSPSAFAVSNDAVYLCKPTEFLNDEYIQAITIFQHDGGASFMVKYSQPCADGLVVHHASMHGGMISGPYWGYRPNDRNLISMTYDSAKKKLMAKALAQGGLSDRTFECVASPNFP